MRDNPSSDAAVIQSRLPGITFDQKPYDEDCDAAGVRLFLHIDVKLDEERVTVFREWDELVLLTRRRQDGHPGLRLSAQSRLFLGNIRGG